MIRVIVSGAAGRMGSMVCATVEEQDDLELVGRYDPAGADGVMADAAELPEADVVIEFTNPDVVMAN
ncbi:MAG: 4-hydroxy-tetrahydrodipicolinate reductase, partial [Actinomycetia bacterium]|nr:4-hydroxy-tetrahydrodipicolinate reductase [Actinomycetes bacterium]